LADVSGFTPTDDGTTATFARDGAAGTCSITYTEAAANGAPTIVADPADLSTC
jgi:hypothetical protein